MENKEFVFILTTSYNAIKNAAGALQLAVNLAAVDAIKDFFLMNEGAFLAKKGFSEPVSYKKAFSLVAELIKSSVEEFNCKFYIRASCVKPYGLEGAEFIKNAEVKPGSSLGEFLMKRQGLTF